MISVLLLVYSHLQQATEKRKLDTVQEKIAALNDSLNLGLRGELQLMLEDIDEILVEFMGKTIRNSWIYFLKQKEQGALDIHG